MINNKPLQNKKVAILAASGVNETDMSAVQRALVSAGALVRIISADNAILNSWNGSGWGLNFPVDISLNTALGVDYDMLVVPGGERAFERLKRTAHSKRFMSSFVNLARPIALVSNAGDLFEAISLSRTGDNFVQVEDNEMQVMINHLAGSEESVAHAA